MKTAAKHGSDVLRRVAEHIDDVLGGQALHLGEPSFRRAFALASFQYQRNHASALKRLVWKGSTGGERTPHEHIREISEEAIGLARIGDTDRARALLASIHAEGLGYSQAAKKDPQYAMWRDLFARACVEDAAGIPQRVAFMVQLIDGLSKTEGSNAGGRVTAKVITWATTAGAGVGGPTLDRLEETGLTSWTEVVTSATSGLVLRWPRCAAAAAVAFGRLAMPFMNSADNALPHLLEHAPDDQLEFIATHAASCAEIDAAEGARLDVLHQIRSGVEARGRTIELAALERWASEGEVKRRRSTDEDELYDVRSLDQLKERLGASEEKILSWVITKVVRRLAPTTSFSELKALLDARPDLLDEERILSVAATLAAKEGALDAVKPWMERLEGEDGSWGGYQSGAKMRLYMLRAELEGDTAREAAFRELAFDLSRGKEWTFSLLPDIGELISLTSPRLSFAEV